MKADPFSHSFLGAWYYCSSVTGIFSNTSFDKDCSLTTICSNSFSASILSNPNWLSDCNWDKMYV